MSAISTSEWATMSPVDRRREIGNMTQSQAAELYASLPSDQKRGPRLNKSEWYALGRTGQLHLLQLLPDWESVIVSSWGMAETCAFKPVTPSIDDSFLHVEGWSKRCMCNLILWSMILPPIGFFLFLFNFWRPGRLAQSMGLLAAGAFMFCVGYPSLYALFSALSGRF